MRKEDFLKNNTKAGAQVFVRIEKFEYPISDISISPTERGNYIKVYNTIYNNTEALLNLIYANTTPQKAYIVNPSILPDNVQVKLAVKNEKIMQYKNYRIVYQLNQTTEWYYVLASDNTIISKHKTCDAAKKVIDNLK